MNTIVPSQFFFGSKEDIDPIHLKDSIWNRMFQEDDVQELTRLRQECKIGSIISWIELFGLRLSEVVNQCTDSSDTIQAWHAHYLIVKIYVWNQEPLYPEWYQQMRAIDSALKTSSLATQWEKTHKLFLKFIVVPRVKTKNRHF